MHGSAAVQRVAAGVFRGGMREGDEMAELKCECCGTPQCRPLARQAIGGDLYVCSCAEEMWCKRCGHCATHCLCAALAELDVPWGEKLMVVKFELRNLGVAV